MANLEVAGADVRVAKTDSIVPLPAYSPTQQNYWAQEKTAVLQSTVTIDSIQYEATVTVVLRRQGPQYVKFDALPGPIDPSKQYDVTFEEVV